MKKTLALLFFCFTFYCGIAQSHNYRPCCRYSKSNVTSECTCPGCQKDKDDEIKAAQEETKQQAAKAAAEQAKKLEADRKAKEEAEQKKLADQKQRDENKIVIGNPNPQKDPINKPVNKKADFNDNTVMLEFQDWEGERLFGVRQSGFMDTSRNLLSFAGTSNSTSTFFNTGTRCYHQSVPYNLGLIHIGYKSIDLVYPSGKKEFNDNSIKNITHLRDDFFLVLKDEHHYLYTIKSKTFIRLPDAEPTYTVSSYTPIFDEPSYVIPDHVRRKGGDYLRYIPDNKALKEKALNAFPDKVTEELLKNNSFCLLISYANNAAFDTHPNAKWYPKFVYVSKDGEIKIK